MCSRTHDRVLGIFQAVQPSAWHCPSVGGFGCTGLGERVEPGEKCHVAGGSGMLLSEQARQGARAMAAVDGTKVRSGEDTAGCRCQAEERSLKLGFCSNSHLYLMEKYTSVNVHVLG